MHQYYQLYCPLILSQASDIK